jgi:UPF0716 protein FxsA
VMKPSIRFGFAGYVLLELWVTLEIAAWLGGGRTFLLLALGVAAGILVLRREKLALFAQLRRAAAGQEIHVLQLPDRALRAVAGLLLIIPGFVSDAAALLLLIPQLRQWLIRRFSAKFSPGAAGSTIIEGDFRRVDDPILPYTKSGP